MTDADDRRFMALALALAARGLGNVWPNPAVGCVLVRNDPETGRPYVIGRGWTRPGGRPHAETEALARAGGLARGATAYVTLEPCAHHGRTPPCAQALIDAGVARVVAAATDPDPRVSGRGLEMLRQAGVEVATGIGEDEALALNAGFIKRVTEGRPLFTLKAATTMDGRIATHSGQSRWITGESARAFGHRLRARHDAIMVGSGTALTDNPMLTCRLPGMEEDGHSPVRIVFDSRMRLPLTSHLVASARQIPTWLIVRTGGDEVRRQAYVDCGVEVIEAEADTDGYPDIRWAAGEFARRGLTRVLVEGGSHLAASLLEHDLVDEIVWMRAPTLIGGDGIPATAAFGVDRLADAPHFRRTSLQTAGNDHIETYRKIGR